MSLFAPSYLTAAIREDGLEGSLASAGSISELIDALVHLESQIGTANFQRQFEINRRGTLSKAIDVMRDAKNAAAQSGQSINEVLRTAQGAKVALTVTVIIIFIGIWSGAAGGLLVGLGVTIVLGAAAWYFWPMLKMTIGTMSVGSTRGFGARGY